MEAAVRREAERDASDEARAALARAGEGRSLAVQRALAAAAPGAAPGAAPAPGTPAGLCGLAVSKELRGLSPALLAKVAARQERQQAVLARSAAAAPGASPEARNAALQARVTGKTLVVLEMVRSLFKLRGAARARMPLRALERELLAVHRDEHATLAEVRGQVAVLLREAPELCETRADPLDGSPIFRYAADANFAAVRARLQQLKA